MSDDVYELRAELDAALTRVKELEAEVIRRDALIKNDGYDDMLSHACGLAKGLDAANADRARLRGVLEQVCAAMQSSGQEPDGMPDPRRPLATAVWAALAESEKLP